MIFIKYLIFGIILSTTSTTSGANDKTSTIEKMKVFKDVLEELHGEIVCMEKKNSTSKAIEKVYPKQIFLSIKYGNVKKLIAELLDGFECLIANEGKDVSSSTETCNKEVDSNNIDKKKVDNINRAKSVMNYGSLIGGNNIRRSELLNKSFNQVCGKTKNSASPLLICDFIKQEYTSSKQNIFKVFKGIKWSIDFTVKDKKRIRNQIFSCIVADIISETEKRFDFVQKSIKKILDWYKPQINIKENIQTNGERLLDMIASKDVIVPFEFIKDAICNADYFDIFLSLIYNSYKLDNLKKSLKTNIYNVYECMLLCGYCYKDKKEEFTQILNVLDKYNDTIEHLNKDNKIAASKYIIPISDNTKFGIQSFDRWDQATDMIQGYLNSEDFLKRRENNDDVTVVDTENQTKVTENNNDVVSSKNPSVITSIKLSDITISLIGKYNMLMILFRQLEVEVIQKNQIDKASRFNDKLECIRRILKYLAICDFNNIDSTSNSKINSDEILNECTDKIFEELCLSGDLSDKLKILLKTIYFNELEKKMDETINDEDLIFFCSETVDLAKLSLISLKKIANVEFVELCKHIASAYKINYKKNDTTDKLLNKIKTKDSEFKKMNAFYTYLWEIITKKEQYNTDEQKEQICYAFRIYYKVLNELFSKKLDTFKDIEGNNIVKIYSLLEIILKKGINSNIFKIIKPVKLLESYEDKNSIEIDVRCIYYKCLFTFQPSIVTDHSFVPPITSENYLDYNTEDLYIKVENYLKKCQESVEILSNIMQENMIQNLKAYMTRIIKNCLTNFRSTDFIIKDNVFKFNSDDDKYRAISDALKTLVEILKKPIENQKIEKNKNFNIEQVKNLLFEYIKKDIYNDAKANTLNLTPITKINENNFATIIIKSIKYYEEQSTKYLLLLQFYYIIEQLNKYTINSEEDNLKVLRENNLLFFIHMEFFCRMIIEKMKNYKIEKLVALTAFIMNFGRNQ